MFALIHSLAPLTHTHTHPFINPSIHPPIYPSTNPSTHELLHPFIHTLPSINPFIHSFPHFSSTHSIPSSIYPLTHPPFIHTSINSTICVLIPTHQYISAYIHQPIHPIHSSIDLSNHLSMYSTIHP